MNVASTCSADLYDISRRKPSTGGPQFKIALGSRKWKFAPGWMSNVVQCLVVLRFFCMPFSLNPGIFTSLRGECPQKLLTKKALVFS